MQKIILDTNFLVYAAKKRLDFSMLAEQLGCQGKHEVVIPTGVISELEGTGEPEGKMLAGVLRDEEGIRKRFRASTRMVEHPGGVDEVILGMAEKGDIVCTHDTRLIERLKGKGIVIANAGVKGFVRK